MDSHLAGIYSHLAGNKLERESHVADKLANSFPDIILEQNNNNGR